MGTGSLHSSPPPLSLSLFQSHLLPLPSPSHRPHSSLTFSATTLSSLSYPASLFPLSPYITPPPLFPLSPCIYPPSSYLSLPASPLPPLPSNSPSQHPSSSLPLSPHYPSTPLPLPMPLPQIPPPTQGLAQDFVTCSCITSPVVVATLW